MSQPISEPQHHYAVVGRRLVHYVRAGTGPPVVLVHASPGDWRSLRPLVAGLARRCTVIAMDTPGHGWSDPLDQPQPEIDDYGRALTETLDAMRLGPVHLYGTHTGAKIALTATIAQPARVASLVLDGLGVATAAERADQLTHYTPVPELRADGGHLVAAWHQVRDMFRFWPWYAQSATHRLAGPEPTPDELHVLVHGLLIAWSRYPLAYRAAFRHDPLEELSRVRVPTALLAAPDDPLHAQLDRIGQLPPNVRLTRTVSDAAEQVMRHVAEHSGPTAPVPSPDRTQNDAATRRFVRTHLGDVHICLSSADDPQRLLIAPLGAYADAPEAGTVVVEVPGSGRSCLQAGSAPTASALADALADACASLGLRPSSVHASGSVTAVAMELGRRLAASVHVTGLRGPDASAELAALWPRADGAHLLAAWHLVRDAAFRHLHASGRWPGTSGSEPDLALIQARTVALAGCWHTLPAVYAACAGVADTPTLTHADLPMWDQFAAWTEQR